MKRLFQRPGSNSSLSRSAKGSAPSSPESAGDGSPKKREKSRERRSYSPDKLASVFRKSSPEKRATVAEMATHSARDVDHEEGDAAMTTQQTLKRVASASISDDELHGRVVEYITAASEDAQNEALRAIHAAILEDVSTSDMGLRVSQKDTDRLVSVCSQRLRLAFQRKLDAFNARVLQGSMQPPSSFLSEEGGESDRIIVALRVLLELLSENHEKTGNHVILVVSERLPSTLVKVLKAFSLSASQSSNDGDVSDIVISLLTRLVKFQGTVHELMEASTLHRLFYLSFESSERQMEALKLVEVLVESMQDALWGTLFTRLHENRCLSELLSSVRNVESLVKVLVVTARILSASYLRNSVALHKQLRVDQFYLRAFSLFQHTFSCEDREQQNNLRVAIGELCQSGSESAMVVADVTSDQCFALCPEKSSPKRSTFNVEAFSLVCQVIEFLHCQNDEKSLQDRHVRTAQAIEWCQRLECQYIQKIGRLIAENRFDYVLIRRSGVMEQLLRRLNKLPDLTKHAIGSVLAATAIEASVIPYSELTTIAVYLGHANQGGASNSRDSDLLVLLGFIANLLRFHEAYRTILRTTGVIEAVLSLFQYQTVLFSSEEVASTKINIAYPTSLLKIGHTSWHSRHSPGGAGSDWVLPVNEKNLVMYLTSHCRQNCAARKLEARHTVDCRVFQLMLEVLTTFAEQFSSLSGSGNHEEEDDEALRVGLCDPPFLECICVLLADERFQDNAVQLWLAVLRIALRIRKQNTSTYNAMNCFLQSLRYVALSLYYKNETGVTFAFQGSASVLDRGLRCLEQVFRPDLNPDAAKTLIEAPSSPTFAGQSDRDRLMVAFIDSGGLFTCLAVCCALARDARYRREQAIGLIVDQNDPFMASDSAFILAMRLVHILVVSNVTVAELFNCGVSFSFYGGLIHQYIDSRTRIFEAQEDIVETSDSGPTLLDDCFQGLLGLSVGDYEVACNENKSRSSRAQTELKITQPGALVTLIQLLRMWASKLTIPGVDYFLKHVAALLKDPENARTCRGVSLCEVLLECFTSIPIVHQQIAQQDQDPRNDSLGTTLLDVNSPYHEAVLDMLRNAAAGGVSHGQVCRWIQLMVEASAAIVGKNRRGDANLPVLEVMPLLQTLSQVAVDAAANGSSRDVPAITFDASRDGFAQMQIPEILVRSQALSSFQPTGQSSTSSSASSSFATLASKVWPPQDGYTVMMWFRIDAAETKDAREKHYWDLLMANQCVLCHSTMRDETSLKCSHRACKACHEALLNCGGECVVCNPPMFYLARFRSGDAKSVSELFLRGPRLCMRTSAATKTGIHQFTHAPLQIGRWYHVAIVHSRQRFQSSQVSLYLNGLQQETVKISYPSSITSGQPLSGLVGIPSQARRTSNSRWTIGPFYLLDEAISAHVVNGIFAAGPSYGGHYLGASGMNELQVSVDHLSIGSLLLLDEYTRDPIRTLIESVEAAERSSKNTILRSSLSLASAASSAAAAIVQDIKARSTSASIFARIPSAVPYVSIPLTQDRIILVFNANTAIGVDLSVIPSGKLDGRPLAQLLGGAEVHPSFSLADTLHDICGSGTRFVYILVEQATSTEELEIDLELLWQLVRGHPKNLAAMEYEHGYGIINFLLHQKPGNFLSTKALSLMFRIVGIDIDDNNACSITPQPSRDSTIRNLLALQHFILDYSLWQNASSPTQKLLFSSLYACLMAGGDDTETLIRERNRGQLQSLSLVRQLLYVFLDPDVESDLLRIIVDLILVCLTGNSGTSRGEASTLDANFAEIASFLASTLSPRFARNRVELEETATVKESAVAARLRERNRIQHASSLRPRMATNVADTFGDLVSLSFSPVDRLCLSPRGRPTTHVDDDLSTAWLSRKHLSLPSSNPTSPKIASSPRSRPESLPSRVRQTQAQDLLLDILAKAVQKHDLKENRERDEVDGLYVDNAGNGRSASSVPTPTSGGSSGGPSGSGQRLQLPSSASKLNGFRKVLSPRWIGYFLFPAADTSCSVTIAPSTVIAALKLLAALLARPRYENVFRRDGYYRLLAQGLPCDHRAFLAVGSSFPFDQMWYSLFCMLLGPPVDGMPHNIQFEMYFLTKDFALNLQRDRLVNTNMSWVILALMRRHYNDAVAVGGLRMLRISPEKSILAQVAHALYAKSPEGTLCHVQVLDFLHHVYAAMPALQNALILAHSTGSSGASSSSGGSSGTKLRSEILEELSLLACSAARAELFTKYSPTEKRVHQTLLNEKRDLNAVEFATCTVQLVELAASEDIEGEDPFQHPVAVRALKMLVAILCDFLVLHPKGVDHVEAFFDSNAGSALAPSLHDGLQLRFQTLVMMSLLEQVRVKFSDESMLTDNKGFATNIKEFMTLAIQRMHMWQRAQHGDACPKAFACCGDKFHFAGGPFVLLDLALFFLGDTTAGVTASASSASSASSTLGQMFQDKLNSMSKTAKPQKRRHTLRNMILGKVQFGSSKSAELDGLASSMYTAVNAVVLHVLQGHGSEVSDDECETLLQLVHIHRDVVLSTRNSQDRDFLVCLSRFLLHLLASGGGEDSRTSGGEYDKALQDIAAHVWIDLMQLQRPFMTDLLTVELRRTGGAPYVVNLIKNGFDALLECPLSGNDAPHLMLIESPAFKKFKGWLEIVGAPLKELETELDRVFVKCMVELKEIVRDAWTAFHKRVAHRQAKDSKRFETRFEWFVGMEREYFETLVDAQHAEFRRQLKWRQDRVDRQKFHARQWQRLRHDLMEQALRHDREEDLSRLSTLSREIAKSNRKVEIPHKQACLLQLDATEGPARMRKRLVAKAQRVRQIDPANDSKAVSTNADRTLQKGEGRSTQPPRRRRYSKSDLDAFVVASLMIDAAPEETVKLQLRPPRKKEAGAPQHEDPQSGRAKQRPLSRRISFENILRRTELDSSAPVASESDSRQRTDSALSATNNHDSDDEGDQDAEASRVSLLQGGPSLDDEDDTDVVDEKLRPLLVPGDEILDIYDCLRVDGMDACPGVFILCSDHVYIIDNYQLVVQYGPTLPVIRDRRGGRSTDSNMAAKVMEVSAEAPTRLERRLSLRFQLPSPAVERPDTPMSDGPLTPSGTLTMQRSSFTHQCRYWAYDDIVELHKRRHQLRHVALELFAHDGRNYLITFESPQQRENVFHSLIAKCPNVRGAANGMDRTTASGDLYSQVRKLLRQNMTERWIAREISNFEYLMHLNTLAGRSYNDLTQYPVFPWVLADYTSPTLDLTDPAVYRDLTKPMGALFREDEFRMRYESLLEGYEETENPMGVKPFHYGTHYSSAGIVLHYLMRMEPFTTHFLRLQGGKFDHADRLFSSVAAAWKSAAGMDNAHNGTQDVKELIPEFFYLPSFLKNVNHRDFGKDQSGFVVDDVELPPWANGSAREFVRLNREALESNYVSANLHHWIDLIFGFKQQGSAAVEACNLFYHLTYEGAVDLDSITDMAMRRAMVDQISEFGQTPSQLFKTPHLPRMRVSSGVQSSTSSGLNGGAGFGETSALANYSGAASIGSPPPPTSGGLSLSTAAGRAALTSSFIEGSDIVSRMHSILNNSTLGNASSLVDDSTVILDHAALLQHEPRRDVGINPLVAAHRGYHQPAYSSFGGIGCSSLLPLSNMRTRQLSSGIPAAPIHQIAIASASVTRDERVATTSDHCLLIPPRHHEFFAWGFQDRTLKILSTGSSEVAHGGESKVLSSFEMEFPISVACMTSDGRMLIAGGAVAPVIRLWQFSSSKRSAMSSGGGGAASGVGRKRAYSVGLHTSGVSSRSLAPLATLCSPSHQAPITAVQVCRAYSVVVSGCAGGTIVLWDLNRLRYLRTLASIQSDTSDANREPVGAIAINEVTGDIAVASGAIFGVYDVNGDLLARLTWETLLHDSQYPRAIVTSIAVNRSEASEWCKEKAVVTGHADGVLCIWAYSHAGHGDGEVSIELKGRHMVSKGVSGTSATSRSAITAVLLTADERKLYTGNADGLLSLWTPMAQGPMPTTPTKSLGASASPMPAHPTNFL